MLLLESFFTFFFVTFAQKTTSYKGLFDYTILYKEKFMIFKFESVLLSTLLHPLMSCDHLLMP